MKRSELMQGMEFLVDKVHVVCQASGDRTLQELPQVLLAEWLRTKSHSSDYMRFEIAAYVLRLYKQPTKNRLMPTILELDRAGISVKEQGYLPGSRNLYFIFTNERDVLIPDEKAFR